MSDSLSTIYKYMVVMVPEFIPCVNFPEFSELLDNVEQIQLGSINFPNFGLAHADVAEQIGYIHSKSVNPDSFVVMIQINPLYNNFMSIIENSLPPFGGIIDSETAKIISADFKWQPGEISRSWVFDYSDVERTEDGSFATFKDSKNAGVCIRLYMSNGKPATTIH